MGFPDALMGFPCVLMGFADGSVVKNLPEMQETQVQFLGEEDPLEKEMATYCSKNSTDRGAWHAAVHGVTKSRI